MASENQQLDLFFKKSPRKYTIFESKKKPVNKHRESSDSDTFNATWIHCKPTGEGVSELRMFFWSVIPNLFW